MGQVNRQLGPVFEPGNRKKVHLSGVMGQVNRQLRPVFKPGNRQKVQRKVNPAKGYR
jgi:hypothetical protein